MSAPNMLTELTKLTQEELRAFMTSGAWHGFTDQEMAEANETDRGTMELFNKSLTARGASSGFPASRAT